MNSCRYEEVEKNQKESSESISKQVLVASTVWLQYFLAGMCVGAPTVFIPQIRKEANSTIVIDDEMGSWLYSTSAFAMLPWIFILPMLSRRFGRKLPQLATAISTAAIFIILYFSQNPYHILIAQGFQGFLYGGNITIRILIVTEYVSIKYRGLFLTIKSASFFWGLWVANAIGTYFYWKNIAIVGFFCSLYSFNVILWPESPYWLASMGRIDECKASYRLLHGYNTDSEEKLKDLISFYDDRHDDVRFMKIVKDREFYKPMLLCILTVVQYHFSGKIVCSLYILDIIKSITNNTSVAYMTMLILDGFSVLGMYFGSYLSKILSRRTLYISSSLLGLFFLLIISIYLYLIRYSMVSENNYILVSLLTLYSIVISGGPIILSLSIFGEIIPIKYQLSSYIVTGFTFAFFFSLLVKFAPLSFSILGVHGTFLFYFITFGLCTIYIYVYLPETKNKSHKEISLFFKNDNNLTERLPLK